MSSVYLFYKNCSKSEKVAISFMSVKTRKKLREYCLNKLFMLDFYTTTPKKLLSFFSKDDYRCQVQSELGSKVVDKVVFDILEEFSTNLSKIPSIYPIPLNDSLIMKFEYLGESKVNFIKYEKWDFLGYMGLFFIRVKSFGIFSNRITKILLNGIKTNTLHEIVTYVIFSLNESKRLLLKKAISMYIESKNTYNRRNIKRLLVLYIFDDICQDNFRKFVYILDFLCFCDLSHVPHKYLLAVRTKEKEQQKLIQSHNTIH